MFRPSMSSQLIGVELKQPLVSFAPCSVGRLHRIDFLCPLLNNILQSLFVQVYLHLPIGLHIEMLFARSLQI